MYIKFTGAAQDGGSGTRAIQVNCPFCGGLGTFQIVSKLMGMSNGPNFSIQSCPSSNCKGLVVVILKDGEIVKTYPGLGKPINTESVPERIKNAFREAVDCFANNCYTASAIMIRKTLEEICTDNDAKGPNLYKRIEALSLKVVIPKELIEAMHELRLLGNDAAHIEAETFNDIGQVELSISIDFTQEILKAIYQYESLLGKLRSLKKTIAPPPSANQ